MVGKKAVILQQLSDPDVAPIALEECRCNEWLVDGSLHGAKLNGAHLPGADLKESDFHKALLVDANLEKANLSGANLKEADLGGANLRGADFTDADLTGANLEAADLTEAIISEIQLARVDALVDATLPDGSRYDGRYLLGGDLYSARRDGAYADQPEAMAEWYGITPEDYQAALDWAEEHLPDLRVAARYAVAGPVNPWADEMRAEGRLTDGSLAGVDLSDENLTYSDLKGAKLPGANFADADLSYADLSEADLSKADLRAANLQGAKLIGANLSGAILDEVDAGGANFENAILEGARVDAAILDLTNLRGTNLTDEQLVWADALSGATMPDGTIYDGRYDLIGDIENALDNGIEVDISEQLAHWYNISVEELEKGQEWARMNLAKLRPDDEE